MQKYWRNISAKGGRGARGSVKARSARIGWKKSPNRFMKRKYQHAAKKPEPPPMGFFCVNENCGKWHEFPKGFDHRKRQYHRCQCGQECSILRGKTKALKGGK
jgi:hypothetical protein